MTKRLSPERIAGDLVGADPLATLDDVLWRALERHDIAEVRKRIEATIAEWKEEERLWREG